MQVTPCHCGVQVHVNLVGSSWRGAQVPLLRHGALSHTVGIGTEITQKAHKTQYGYVMSLITNVFDAELFYTIQHILSHIFLHLALLD